jgi:hypothetical protein
MTTGKPRTRARAEAKITVQSSEAKPYDQTSPALMEIRLSETFTGDINGEATVRALQVLREDQSASLVTEQRFRGKPDRRVPHAQESGALLSGNTRLQASESFSSFVDRRAWFPIPPPNREFAG